MPLPAKERLMTLRKNKFGQPVEIWKLIKVEGARPELAAALLHTLNRAEGKRPDCDDYGLYD